MGICPLGEIFTKEIEIFAIFSYLSPYFYTDNVKNSLQRTNLGIYIYKNKGIYIFKKNKFSSESLKGPAGIALPSGGDA